MKKARFFLNKAGLVHSYRPFQGTTRSITTKPLHQRFAIDTAHDPVIQHSSFAAGGVNW